MRAYTGREAYLALCDLVGGTMVIAPMPAKASSGKC